jgi:hypothetical protein
MDKAPPAQNVPAPNNHCGWGELFLHDGEAQCVLSNLAASRPVRVEHEASLWLPVNLPS